MRKVFFVALALMILVSVPASRGEAIPWWVIIPLAQNLLNRKATEPMDRSTSEARVTANAEWSGKTIGTQFDLTHWVVGVRKGARLQLEAVLVAKPELTKVVGARITSNWPEFETLEAITPPVPDKRGNVRLRANEIYVSDTGCIFPVETTNLQFRGYTLCVDLFFTNGKKQAGLFGTERVKYSDSTRTLVQLVLMDDQQISAQVNDPETQKALQWSFGLQPAVPQVNPLQIPAGFVGGPYSSSPATQPAPQPTPLRERVIGVEPPRAAPTPVARPIPPATEAVAQTYTPPTQPTPTGPGMNYDDMPIPVARWFKLSKKPLDREWWAPCTYPAPIETPGKNNIILCFRTGDREIAEEGAFKVFFDGVPGPVPIVAIGNSARGVQRWMDGSPKQGVHLVFAPPGARVRIELIVPGGENRGFEFDACQDGWYTWHVLDVR